MTAPPRLPRWHPQPDAARLDRAVAAEILRAAARAREHHSEFRIVLAGGNTPSRLYASLCSADTDWAAWRIYFGDERCLPPDHSERNSRMAAGAWLDHVAIRPDHVHPIPAELGAAAAAAAYAQTLASVGEFDLVLLGLGDDGHTASLFPGHDWGTAAGAPAVLPIVDAPKPPPERVSLSARRLSAARQVIFLVSGETKRPAVAAWQAGASIPAAAIAPAAGVDVFLDFPLPEVL